MATNLDEGASERPVIAFDGAISTRAVPHPGRVFAAEIEFDLEHPQLIKLASKQKPPLHFHPYHREYMQVLEGLLCVEIDGVERNLTNEDGEIVVEPWAHHRLYPPPRDGLSGPKTVFLLSGDDTPEVFKLDFVFFQNWYGYQDECVLGGKSFDLIQVLCMFDAGASYLSFPRWILCGRTLSRALGIVFGRWIGGLLGYQPFYRQWTTDWDRACARMEKSIFQRRFADRTKAD
ncbi:hypothetical protein V8F20_011507 [Naviculisporaceae sp. PSN 640]